MVLFIMLHKVALTFESVDESVTIQIKAIEQYLPVVLFNSFNCFLYLTK